MHPAGPGNRSGCPAGQDESFLARLCPRREGMNEQRRDVAVVKGKAYMCRESSCLCSSAYSLERESPDILQARETSPEVRFMSSLR